MNVASLARAVLLLAAVGVGAGEAAPAKDQRGPGEKAPHLRAGGASVGRRRGELGTDGGPGSVSFLSRSSPRWGYRTSRARAPRDSIPILRSHSLSLLRFFCFRARALHRTNPDSRRRCPIGSSSGGARAGAAEARRTRTRRAPWLASPPRRTASSSPAPGSAAAAPAPPARPRGGSSPSPPRRLRATPAMTHRQPRPTGWDRAFPPPRPEEEARTRRPEERTPPPTTGRASLSGGAATSATLRAASTATSPGRTRGGAR